MGILNKYRNRRKYDDEELMQMMRQGGREEGRALQNLYQHLFPAIVHWVKQNGGREADGEDAFQIGMLAFQVALRQGRFAGEEKVQAFIWKAAKMAWRMRCRKWETRMSGLSESFDLPDPAHGRWMREFVHDEVYRDQIRAMLGRACPKCARLFELQFFRGFGDDALADDLGVRNSTLKVKRSRCLKKLREYIESHPEAARLFEDSAINIHTP